MLDITPQIAYIIGMAKKKSRRFALPKPSGPYLVACGLIRHGDELGQGAGYRSHAEIRRALGDENPYVEREGDICGFWSSEGKFLTRYQASFVGAAAGQVSREGYAILSSDVSWREP